MKKYYLSIWMLTVMLTMTGCFSDDSSVADVLISDITISGVDESYNKIAYVGEKLVINPTIATDYSDMTYEWLLLSPSSGSKSTAEATVIGTDKDLSYDINLPPGTYQVRLNAMSAGNGYTKYALASLIVQTEFSSGFYVLKETPEGKTDLDLVTKDKALAENLLTKTKGQPLTGKPQSLWINYGQYYVNPDNNVVEAQNSVTVITEANEILVNRTTDFKTMFDRSSLLFEKMDEDEVPYAMFFQSMMGTVYASNKGFRTANSKSAMFANNPTSGQFGFPVLESGASKFVIMSPSSNGMYYWDQSAHSLMTANYNMMGDPLTYKDHSGTDQTQNLTDYDCLSCGVNVIKSSETDNFILEDKKTGKRYVYLMNTTFSSSYLTKRVEVPATSRMAQAGIFATNAISARYIYFIFGNKLYGYNFSSDDFAEIEMPLQGIGSGETITYIANQFVAGTKNYNYDYFIVVTQQGARYRLYFYEMAAGTGTPTGAPVKTFTGTGTVKSVRGLVPEVNLWWGQYAYPNND